jgi:hypothetical protein
MLIASTSFRAKPTRVTLLQAKGDGVGPITAVDVERAVVELGRDSWGPGARACRSNQCGHRRREHDGRREVMPLWL